jgi:hypothetical protein
VFFVGDQVIYSGTIWQRASGASGTVTSVAVTETGDALTITGSPITTSGTINIGFAGTSGQYINGAGNLTTFPSLAGYVTGTGTTNYLSKFTSASDIGNSLVYDNGTNVIIGNGTTDIQGRLQVTTSAGALLLNTDNINFAILFRNTASSNKLWDISSFNNDLVFNEGGVGSRLYLKAGGDVGIGNTTPAYKLDVSGTGRFTGELRLESTITNGTFTYTLPAATGTLALTSDLSGYVPYTGATANVNLGTFNLTADVITGVTGSFASNGGSDTFAINHSSGSGKALNITKGGSGEGLYINKTSGSGNAATITGGVTLLSELHLTTDLADAYIASAATWNAKQNAITLTTTGTSGAATLVGATLNIPQYQGVLTNPVTGTGLNGAIPKFTTTGSTIGSSIIFDSGTQIGINTLSPSFTLDVNGTGNFSGALSGTSGTFSSSVTANSIIKTGGTSAQILAADGSVITAGTNITISGGTISSTGGGITGSGTTNYVTKFTGASSIGNSLIFDNGTNIGIGLTSPSYKLDVQDNGVSGIVDVSSFSVTGNGGSGRGVGILLGAAGSSNSVQVARLVGYQELANPVAVAASFAIQVANSSGTLTERLRITQAGNLLIGSTGDNGSRLQVNGTTSNDLLYLDAGINTDYAFKIVAAANDVLTLRRQHATVGALDIISFGFNGNVGIGLTSPATNLQVTSGSNTYVAHFYGNGGSNGIAFGTLSGNIAAIQGFTSSFGAYNNISLQPSGGNVGIGVTTPLSILDVREANRTNGTNITNFGVYTTSSQGADVGGTIGLGGLFNGSSYAPFASIRGGKENSISGNYAGYISFQTIIDNSSLGERMRITSGGSVLINRSSNPYESTYKFIIKNTTDNNIGFGIQEGELSIEAFNDAISLPRPLRLYASKFSMLGGNVGIGTSSPNQKLTIADASYPILGFNIGSTAQGYIGSLAGGGIAINSQIAQPIMLYTNDTERMRITSGGTGLFSTTTASAGDFSTASFQVGNQVVSKGSLAGFFWESRSGGVTINSNWYGWYAQSGTIYLYNGSANIAVISGSNGLYTAISDINKKKDFEDSTIGLNAIMGLKPTLFRMKEEDESAEKKLGFIAQQVKEFIPQAYVEGEDFIGLSDRPIIAALVKAIQEQQGQIEELKELIKNK